jgi:hypothetical protein
MKNIIALITIIAITITSIFAQEKGASFTYVEFKAGYGISQLGAGLKDRYEAGHFATSGGFLATLAGYHKFSKVNNLNFGIKYKSLGAFVSNGDNGQEMFFNYWGAAAAIKYFPFDKDARKGFFVQGDYFFITQFTQKYTQPAIRAYTPQYGLGMGYAVGIGYDFSFKGDTKTLLTLGLEYEYDSRQGEVAGAVNETTYNSSNIGVLIGIKF